MPRPLIFLLALLAPAAAAAPAEITYYDIEVLIFQHLDPAGREAEAWPVEVDLPQPEHHVELGLPLPVPLPEFYDRRFSYQPLPPEALQLGRERKALEESPAYRVLLHLGWRQPGLPAAEALPVRIERRLLLPPPADQDTAETTGAGAPAAGVPLEARMEGFIRVFRARYLHLQADLVLREQPPAGPPWQAAEGTGPEPGTWEAADTEPGPGDAVPAPPVFRLHQSRRMRSRELHYLDHPVLGMLVVARPFTLPETRQAAR